MSKSVSFRMPAPRSGTADDWIEQGVEPHLKAPKAAEAATSSLPLVTKRFTIDVPIELHSRIKMVCAQRSKVMADEIRRLLEVEFPAES